MPRLYGPLAAVRHGRIPAGDHRHDRRSRAGHPMRASVPVHPRRHFRLVRLREHHLRARRGVPAYRQGRRRDSGDHPDSGRGRPLPHRDDAGILPPSETVPTVHLRHQRDARADRRHVCQPLLDRHALAVLVSACGAVHRLGGPQAGVEPQPPVRQPSGGH